MKFTGARIETLETGCEIDVHFVADATAGVFLNYYVYVLEEALVRGCQSPFTPETRRNAVPIDSDPGGVRE